MCTCTVGDHGDCECAIVNSRPGLPGPAGERGDAGMIGEFGQEGDVGDPGPQGEDGLPVRMIKLFHLHSVIPFFLLFVLILNFSSCRDLLETMVGLAQKVKKEKQVSPHRKVCVSSCCLIIDKHKQHMLATNIVKHMLMRDFVYVYRISWRPRGSWARWGTRSNRHSRSYRFAWFPWAQRSSCELTVVPILISIILHTNHELFSLVTL